MGARAGWARRFLCALILVTFTAGFRVGVPAPSTVAVGQSTGATGPSLSWPDVPTDLVGPFAIVGDLVVPLDGAGQVITQGSMATDGACRLDQPLMFGIVERSVPEADSVTLSFDGACRLYVRSLDTTSARTAASETRSRGGLQAPAIGSTNLLPGTLDSAFRSLALNEPSCATDCTWYEIAAKATVLEQFNVTATELLSDVQYMQYPNPTPLGVNHAVWDGGRCETSRFPGWFAPACSVSERSHEPMNAFFPFVYWWINFGYEGAFTHTFTPVSYVQHLSVQAFWGQWSVGCGFSLGSLPVGWDLNCHEQRSAVS